MYFWTSIEETWRFRSVKLGGEAWNEALEAWNGAWMNQGAWSIVWKLVELKE